MEKEQITGTSIIRVKKKITVKQGKMKKQMNYLNTKFKQL